MSKRILSIDDDPSISKIIKSVLAKNGFDVSSFNDSEAGLAEVLQGGYDLIILDVMMPGMDGFEVCNKIKNNEKTQNLPVIFLTAKAQMKDMLHGYFQGAHLYMSKPFTSATLLENVRQLLGENT